MFNIIYSATFFYTLVFMCDSHKIKKEKGVKNPLVLKNEDGLRVLFNLCYYFTAVWLCIKIYLQVGLVLTHLKEIKGDVILFSIHLAAYNVILLWL